jgi:hypothetical protein
MFLWISSTFFLLMSLRMLSPELASLSELVGLGRNEMLLKTVSHVLQEIEETLLAGMIPAQDRWVLIQKLPVPWGRLAGDSLNELRASGGSLIPTLRRIRELAEAQIISLSDARARSSQASGQALACSMLVPALGMALYFLLPTVQEHAKSWVFACCVAMMLTGIGALWLLRIAELARWGGLAAQNRSWFLSSQCAGERFLALLKTGTPPDLAWAGALDLLTKDSRDLALNWGYSIWEPVGKTRSESFVCPYGPAEMVILEAGNSIKKSIQVSTMEGRPCVERVETVFKALRQEMKSLIERELGLLATRALKPLFICIAPALFGLLTFGLWLAAGDVVGDLGDF